MAKHTGFADRAERMRSGNGVTGTSASTGQLDRAALPGACGRAMVG
ncbi:hypothetical protein [Dokdonella sp.]|nr:hypothetical protein [Dokdonella sp.]HPN80149.1 hypothetical protein [Dokdonella sp.]